MKKKNQTLTQLTLATTLVVAPTLAPLTIHAEEVDPTSLEEQSIKLLSGPTLENERLLEESLKESEALHGNVESNKENESETSFHNQKEASKNQLNPNSVDNENLTLGGIESSTLNQSFLYESETSSESIDSKATNSFVLSQWNYTDKTDSILLTGYKGTSTTSYYIPGMYNGKRIIIKDFSIFPKNAKTIKFSMVNSQKVGLETTTLARVFAEHSSINTLDLSGLDTSNVTNMSEMFYNCWSLKNLNIEGLDTSNVTDMSRMFYYTRNLINLDLSGWDTSSVTTMKEMFCDAKLMTTLNLSGWDTSNVTDMSGMFQGMMQLRALDISHFNTSKVTDMSNLFRRCWELKSLDMSHFDTSNVTDMSYMFAGLRTELIDTSLLNTSKVTNMQGMFAGLDGATLEISNLDTSNVTNMSYMFSECYDVEFLDLSFFDTSNVQTMEKMFYECHSLKTIKFDNWDTSKVTNMSYMFANSESLSDLDLSGWNTSNVTDMSYMFSIVTVPSQFISSSVKNVEDSDLENLTDEKIKEMIDVIIEITIENRVYMETTLELDLSHFDTSSVTNMEGMFYGGSNIATLDLSGWNTSNVTNMSFMFTETLLEELTLSHFDTSKVVTMESMFERSYRLKSLAIEGWDTSNVEDMSWMFKECYNLNALDLRHFDTSNVESMAEMFALTYKLASLNLSGWDTANVTDMTRMFGCAFSLTTLDLSDFDTSKVEYMEGMFAETLFLRILNLGTFDLSNVYSGETEGLFASSLPRPLVVITSNEEFKTYDFANDNRTSVQFRLETNGGIFADGTTEFISPEFLVIESQEDIEQLIQSVGTPTKEGYQFVSWELDTPLSDNELEAFYQRISGTHQAKWRLPNVAPIIVAEDVTLYQGDFFNALDYVSATDDEDGPITLTEANVTFNNVDPLTPGIYQVTYEVTDQDGATVSKTITVTVLEKEVIETPEDESSTDDLTEKPSKPNKPSTEKPNQESSKPTTEKPQTNGTSQEMVETGFTNLGVIIIGLIALIQGWFVGRRSKE